MCRHCIATTLMNPHGLDQRAKEYVARELEQLDVIFDKTKLLLLGSPKFIDFATNAIKPRN